MCLCFFLPDFIYPYLRSPRSRETLENVHTDAWQKMQTRRQLGNCKNVKPPKTMTSDFRSVNKVREEIIQKDADPDKTGEVNNCQFDSLESY